MKAGSARRQSLVTGGAGFIGSHLVEHLLGAGEVVTVIDDFSTGSARNLAHLDEHRAAGRLAVLEADLMEALPQLAEHRFDAIYHLAAAVGVRLVVEQPIHTIETNVLETSALLRFAAKQGTPTLIASTSEVYGKGSRTPFVEDDDVVYGATIYSRWSYACSKAIDEYLALAYARERGLAVVIPRFFNTVGPRQTGAYGMVLPRFVHAALRGEPIEVHGDGLQSRCFCDVRDVVPVMPKLLGSASCHGRVFNLGRDESISIGGLARLVKDTLQSKSRIVNVPYEEVFGSGFDDLRTRQPDLTRIREAVGFVPKIPLETTIRDVAAELQQRPSAAMTG